MFDFYYENRALEIVSNYITEHQDAPDPMPIRTVFIVREYETLQNRKYLLRSTLFGNVYYELAYNRDKKEWHLDVYTYKKLASKVVKETADKEKRKEQ